MSDFTDRVAAALRTAGALTSAELQQMCGASQATVSRALAPLLASGVVLKVGRTRAQAYVMPRHIEGVSTTGTVPIMKVDANGGVAEFGTLIPTTGGRCWVEEFDTMRAELHAGLPWFISDMRPQGFVGRAFAQAHKALQLAPNPEHWTDDDILHALCQVGDDQPGNLIVGAAAFDRFTKAPRSKRISPGSYPELADAAVKGALPGSSAGGEQPKFCVVRDDGQPVIVKFSPAGKSPAELRWRDLLVCEHLALETLREAGVAAAKTKIVEGGGRVLLEVERFDRTKKGRIGMVSLLAFDMEYIGKIDNWGAAAERMVTRGMLAAPDSERLRLLEAYGSQIGNTDRHYGNISLLIGTDGNWVLAPAYDMLPMAYAPVGGEVVPREDADFSCLSPTAETLRVWAQARVLAGRFWSRAAADKRITGKEFRRELQRHAKAFGAPAADVTGAEEPAFQRARRS